VVAVSLVFDLDGGGLETLVGAMARHLHGSLVRVSIITLGGRAGRVGSQVAPLVDQFHVLRPKPLVSMLLPVSIVRALRCTRPDVVHLHSGAWYKCALAARLAGVRRVVFTEHGREHYDPLLVRRLDQIAARWTDAVVPVSDRLQDYLHQRLGIPRAKLHVIENGVDHEVFSPGPSPADLRAQLGIPADALVLGSVGRLEPVKAYDRLIQVFAQLRAGGRVPRPLYLVICGEGSHRPALEAAAAASGCAEAVRLPGWIDRTADFYRLLDVFSLISTSEGTSVSLLEAMAGECAMVVTDVGSNARVLGGGLAGQVVASGDVAAFTVACEALLASAEHRARVGGLARRRVLERYTLVRMLEAYEQLYRRLTSQ
jgi:glycosyltransferase involved in cell wall biosynthesis